MQNIRISELRAPELPQTTFIIAGYIFAFCGGVLGAFIGWHLLSYKKTLPNGERVFGYNEKDRKHGRIIFYISIAVFVVFMVLKFLVDVN